MGNVCHCRSLRRMQKKEMGIWKEEKEKEEEEEEEELRRK